MQLTSEQQDIISNVTKQDLIKINAKAGTGKTFMLLEIVNHLKPKKALYTAFNKPIVKEATTKFSNNVECKTLHALAYKYSYSHDIGSFNYTTITEPIKYADKYKIIKVIDKFNNSSKINIYKYISKNLSKPLAKIATKYVNLMIEGAIPISFGFMIKCLHLNLVNNNLTIPEYDLLMLDEAGDTSEVLMEIFMLLPAKKKVIVGDPHQNIYAFMDTIDGFKYLEGKGITLPLTKSFRVSTKIASRVAIFCNDNLCSSFIFKGTDTSEEDTSIAYIARTNATLISRIIKLQEDNREFTILREVSELFATPLALINVMSGRRVTTPALRHLERDFRKFKVSKDKSFYSYLSKHFAHDIQLLSAIKLLKTHSPSAVYRAFTKCKTMKSDPSVTVTTAFTSKGLEFGSVYIEDDMNKVVTALTKVPHKELEASDTIELNLAYVACTRAKHSLLNCKFI